MGTRNRILIITAVAAVFVAMLAMPAMAGPAGQFISKINASRAAAGLAPLASHGDLADDARAHSNLMADRQELFHSSNLGSVTSGWEKLGENVGVNLDVAGMHTAFMNSSGHRANILGDYNYVGVGVTVDDAGFMWATIIFMKKGSTAPTTTTAPPTTTTTEPSSPEPSPTTTQPPAAGAESSAQPKAQKAAVRSATVASTPTDVPLRVLGDPLPPAYAI